MSSREGYRGRFAPSPTGDLHFGSLVAAVASWLDARAAGGRWLVRIEDVDRQRTVPGSAPRILATLAAFGLDSDEAVVFQSDRAAAYRDAVVRLARAGQLCACACTRADLAARPGGLHRGSCRPGADPLVWRGALRLLVPAARIAFVDRACGWQVQSLAETVGDFTVWRVEGHAAYHLAVVVDDAAQGITDVVRGADLLDSTPRQILLQQRLGLPQPRYLHVPLVRDETGRKLSKSDRARPVDAGDRRATLAAALRFLGIAPSAAARPAAMLADAVAQWGERYPWSAQTRQGRDVSCDAADPRRAGAHRIESAWPAPEADADLPARDTSRGLRARHDMPTSEGGST